ncbi:GspE/PulE family protein [Glaciecola siphonariae]|uniref:GspE/PulE family protein n=1 Tax=Glaciecola siphonariae TaxID=521012 RepID=A0ABV9LU78_9ALTE
MIHPLQTDLSSMTGELIDAYVKHLSLTQAQINDLEQTVNSLAINPTKACVRLALCSEEKALEILAKTLGWELIDKELLCPDALSLIQSLQQLNLSVEWAIKQQTFVELSANQTRIYLSQYDNLFALSVLLSNTPETQSIQLCLLSSAMSTNLVDELEREVSVNQLFSSKNVNAAALAEEAPVINLVNSVIEKAIIAEASDIHIEAGNTNMHIRFRVDGKMHTFMQQPMARFPAISSRIKLISDLDIAERRLPQDGRFTTNGNGQLFDVRVSSAPDVNGESIVMRLLPKKRDELSLKNLGFEADHLEMITKWGKLTNGIVLVTGPTGSGKSTTLYGLLAEIKTGTEKIVTVEDPVEYQLEGITQVQAKADIGYTFAKALRTFLRQDPDVIMVGEIRDKETADIAVQSSLTGHLVLSTLHTNDACSVFPRLSDMGVEPYLIAATIQGVQAQRLVRRLCQSCAQPSAAPTFMDVSRFEQQQWKQSVGCDKCHGRGYKGRLGIYELVPVSPKLRELISRQAPLSELRQCAADDGARDLLKDGLLKASKGLTSVEEVLRVCSNSEGAE